MAFSVGVVIVQQWVYYSPRMEGLAAQFVRSLLKRWWFLALNIFGFGSLILTFLPAYVPNFSIPRYLPVLLLMLTWFWACFRLYRDSELARFGAPKLPHGFVILVNGASGVGKTTVASALAHRYNVYSVFGADLVREGMRFGLQPTSGDPRCIILASSFLAYEHLPKKPQVSMERKVIDGFRRQSQFLVGPTVMMINRIRRKRGPAIIEGVNLIASQIYAEIPNDPHNRVMLINLHINSEDIHLHRIRQRGETGVEPPDVTDRYVRNIKAIRVLDRFLKEDTQGFAARHIGTQSNLLSIENSGEIESTIRIIDRNIREKLELLEKLSPPTSGPRTSSVG